MKPPLREQVVVITGASSGIGRETARRLGERAAAVVLAARNGEALAEAAGEVEQAGGRAEVVPTDVSDWRQVERLAEEAVTRFGRIDGWINNAGVYYVGPVETMQVSEIERLLQVNLLGQIYGMKAALPAMIRQERGTIVNVASGLAVRGASLVAAYAASKHAIKGFSESLRLELARDHPGIQVTTILPASINTPLFQHARARIGVQPRPLPPVYAPRVAAEAIIDALEHRRRDVYAGPARTLAMLEGFVPALVDRFMLLGNLIERVQRSDAPYQALDNLFAPMPLTFYGTTGEWRGEAMPVSLTTRAFELHPRVRQVAMGAAVVAGTGAAVAGARRVVNRDEA